MTRNEDAGTGQPPGPDIGQAVGASQGQPADAGVARPEPTGPVQRMFVLGSSVNLRKEPSAQAEVMEKLPIGTECTTSSPAGGEWLKVDCGGKVGFMAASLMGPQKPSAEQHRTEAQDPRLPLAQRLESALRAATLAPEDAALRELLGDLFYERQLELAAADKPSARMRAFSRMCQQETDTTCLHGHASFLLKGVCLKSQTRNGLFVVAMGAPERVVVYRGRYRFPQEREDSKGYLFQGELRAMESFTPTTVLEEALFGRAGECNRAGSDMLQAIPFGEFVLDETSQALLQATPRQWARLEPAPDRVSLSKVPRKGPSFDMLWNCPESKPAMILDLEVDIHGRWRLGIPEEGTFWISGAEKADGGLKLTLVKKVETWVEENQRHRRKQETMTKQVLFKRPPENGDVAWLGDVPYSSKLSGYPQKYLPPCP